MKFNKIGDLRAVICEWEKEFNDRAISPTVAMTQKQLITEEVIRKIASGSCAHPPTWCKELLRL